MKYQVLLIGIYFLFVSCNPNHAPSPTPIDATLPPSTGDWVITSNVLIEDKSLVLNGNIQIKSGGQLTLRRTQLAMGNQFGINVESNGGITIENETVIKPAKDTGRFTFVVRRGAIFVMRESELQGCGWGIPYQAFNDENTGLFIYADDAVLERNLFSNNFNGVVLKNAGNARITANRFSKNTWSGVSLWNSENSNIGDNTFEDGNNGIMMAKDFNNVIAGNTFSRLSEGGLILFYSRNNEIRGNTFKIDSPTGLGWTGIALLKVSRNNRILNNSFSGGKDGVVILHSLNNTVEGNTLDGSWNGFQVHYSNGNCFANNTLVNIGIGNCPYGGIFLNQSSDNKIFNNRIGVGGREPGIVLMGSSSRNTLAGNVITAGFRGLMLHGAANNNSIQDNSFSAEVEEDVVIDQSFGNVFHHNNFMGNKRGYDNGANSWDDGSAGNYWGLFAGGNSFAIPPNGSDRYPWAAQIPIPTVDVPALTNIEMNDPALSPSLTITNEATYENQTLTFGSLIIEGKLTLNNVNILVDGGFDDGGIIVKPGGSLSINNSSIRPTESGGGYLFQVNEGSTFILKNSTVKGSGFYYGGDWGGIYIKTDGVIIENNLISDSFRGLTICPPARGNHLITGNTFQGCHEGISLDSQADSQVTNNKTDHCIGGGIIVMGGAGISVNDNQTLYIWTGAGIIINGGTSHTIMRNTVTSLRARWGISISGDGHHLVADNIISSIEY